MNMDASTKEILVDDRDRALLAYYKWRIDKRGYVVSRINGDLVYLHTLIMLPPPGFEVDHRNRMPWDCRRDNMRNVTHQVNMQNLSLRKDNLSGIAGVSLLQSGMWKVRINTGDSKMVHLGHFKDFFEACCARKSAENRYYS